MCALFPIPVDPSEIRIGSRAEVHWPSALGSLICGGRIGVALWSAVMVRDMPMLPIIHIAAALLCDSGGRMLLVRKRGTAVFMQPGGKIAADEDAVTALVRELREELGIVVPPALPVYLGCFAAPAAHEPGHVVRADLFFVELVGTARVAAEIEEMIWVTPEQVMQVELAPLTRDHVVPIHRELCRSRVAVGGMVRD